MTAELMVKRRNKMKGNKELIKRFLEDSKFQDKLDYDKEKAENCLIDYIDIYQEIYSMEDNEISDELGIINKEDALKRLETVYKVQLNVFKKFGGNISEYPKSLENLIK